MKKNLLKKSPKSEQKKFDLYGCLEILALIFLFGVAFFLQPYKTKYIGVCIASCFGHVIVCYLITFLITCVFSIFIKDKGKRKKVSVCILWIVSVLFSVRAYLNNSFSQYICGLDANCDTEIVKHSETNNPITGIVTGKFPDEKFFSGTFKDGKPDGILTIYYKNGQIASQTEYKNGLKHGFAKGYNESGRLKGEEHYQNGKHFGKMTYYEDGKLRGELSFKDDKRDGVLKIWYENGQLAMETNFKNDLADGVQKVYYSNGQLAIEGYFKDGKKDGIFKIYRQDGTLETEGHFKNDQLTSGNERILRQIEKKLLELGIERILELEENGSSQK